MMHSRHGGKALKLQISVAQKMTITEVTNFDPIAVYLEDFGPGQGKVTITCSDDSWSRYWSHMGEKYDIRAFLLKADEHYLAGKFAPQLDSAVDDLGKLANEAKKHVIKYRRERPCCVSKDKARELFDMAEELESLHDEDPTGYRDAMFDIFGDEWWYSVPKKANHQYEYLCRIINTIKEALRQAS